MKAVVFGAGISGKGAEYTLKKIGYEVYLIDDKVGISSKKGIEILENENIEIFIKSPGTPYTPLVKKAKSLGVDVIDDIELGYRVKKMLGIKGKIIAITGTNGKTTITSKICELLNNAKYKAKVCGNIGASFSQTILENTDLDFYVLEMSSYQLENLKEFKADIAMISNLAPDHLTRYKNVEEYYDTKLNIMKNQTKEDHFILNLGCENLSRKIGDIVVTKHLVGIEKKSLEQECWCDNNYLIYRDEKIVELNKVALKGKHNLENMLFIVTVGKILNIDSEIISKMLIETTNLEHRMEIFYKYGENIFINDSKGTNIDSTKFAIEAYNNPILICGGSNKNLDLMPLAKIIKNRVKEVYLIGEIADILENDLRKVGYENSKIYNLKNLENTLDILRKRVNRDENNVILFSPATASFDQFKNFEERGRIFKELVRKKFY